MKSRRDRKHGKHPSTWRWFGGAGAFAAAVGLVLDLNEAFTGRRPVILAIVVIVFFAFIVVLGYRTWRDHLHTRRLHRFRGVVQIGAKSQRQGDYEGVWADAKEHVLCMGMGMRNVVDNLEDVRHAVERGVRADFIMLDPAWLEREPEIANLLSSHYGGTSDIPRICQDSLDKLLAFKSEMHLRHGANRVGVHLYRHGVLMSATLADFRGVNAFGVVEFHLYKGSSNRVRLHVVEPGSGGSVLSEVLASIKFLLPEATRDVVFS